MSTTTNTKQQQFATSVLMAQDTLKASGLKKMAERGNAKGGESYTFYRKKKATAKDGIPSMFNDSFTGEGGDFDKFQANIAQISSQDKLAETDMLKTKLDLKSPIVSSMTNAVLQKEDEKIIAAIAAAGTLATAGKNTKTVDDIENIKILIQRVRSAHVWAKNGIDQKKGVAIVMNEEDYSVLASSEIFINGDYQAAFGGGTGDTPLTFFGAEIIISEQVAKGTFYIIPSYTFGFAEWENSITTDMVFMPTDGRTWHLQITKSVGVVVIAPEKITKFTFKV
jgi:phage capsid family|nr:MAG TPA: head protein [Caudoviricetes sp.]